MRGKKVSKLTGVACLTVIALVGQAADLHASNWWETIKVKGDLRYRHEMIDTEARDARHRHRIRARIGISGKVSPYTTVDVQLATGSDDPVSTNQTLGDAFSTKSIGLDMAYFEATHPSVPGFKITGGKFKNPFYLAGGSELIWDSDWNPEGGVIDYERKYENINLALMGAGLWIDERSSSDDSYLAAVQGMGRIHLNEKKSSVAIGLGFFNYVNAKGFAPFFEPEDSKGNLLIPAFVAGDTVQQYATDFELIELSAEATHQFESTPVTVMADYVMNSAADSFDTGWLIGFRVGKVKTPGSWEFRYIYRDLEADAVVGAFTDSDFRGGGTDAKGHEIGGALQLAENTAFNATYFINEIGLEADDTDGFNRMQLDLQLKF